MLPQPLSFTLFPYTTLFRSLNQIFFYRAIVNRKKVIKKSGEPQDRKSTRLNSSHVSIAYAVFCLKKKKNSNRKHPHHYQRSAQEGPETIRIRIYQLAHIPRN